jgi:[acyl-carrier-protein] S-malonyltransferase
MGTALRQASRSAEDLFQLAEDVTGLPLRQLCEEGPLSELTRTSVAQIGVVVVSLAAAAHLDEMLGRRPEAIAVAGHSVGELAAYCWAGALDAETTIRLVHRRGQLMERDSSQVDGTMVAVLNLGAEALVRLCSEASARTGSTVQVANLNAPGQVVLSGERTAIAAASELATAAGARRVIPLTVGGPFHSRYMEAAARNFADAVSRADFHQPHTPIVLNTTAAATTNVEALRGELVTQITSPVRWEESVQALARMGCTSFVELGPGQVLTGLVRRTCPEAHAVAAGTPEEVNSIVQQLAGAASR